MLPVTPNETSPQRKPSLLDRRPQPLGHIEGLLGLAMMKKKTELVAAEPCNHVERRHMSHQQSGQTAEQLVAREMSTGVVDDLELIEVEQDHGVRHIPRLELIERRPQAPLEFPAIGQAGQRSCDACQARRFFSSISAVSNVARCRTSRRVCQTMSPVSTVTVRRLI